MMLKPILAGTLKLDGGAMFGVVPKKFGANSCLLTIKIYVPGRCAACTSKMMGKKY
ncbi:MAG: hypothetical protein IPI18_19900 [Saprospiraceae bacterium]|nr:hypothetical protein [Saprospiraceae bacterium]MBK8777684.1 hypothetical protein [Saprospiraceae bacterium]